MIRRVRLDDLDEIMLIERASFSVAWEYSVFLNICLQEGQIESGEWRTLFMDVIEKNGKVVGYAVWEINEIKSSGHILNLAIHADERRKGRGSKLLLNILNHLRANDIRTCDLEVRESNIAARALYEANGFTASSKIPMYYFNEDAIVYSLNL